MGNYFTLSSEYSRNEVKLYAIEVAVQTLQTKKNAHQVVKLRSPAIITTTPVLCYKLQY